MYSRPLPSRCARHPPPERGWAGKMEERTALLSLASHRLRGEGDHEVVEGGGLQWRPMPAKRAIKLIARRAIPPPFEPFEPYEPSEPSQRRCVQWHSRIGGGERSEPVSRMVIITYDTER